MADLALPGAGEASEGSAGSLAQLPSIDRLLNAPACVELVGRFGPLLVKRAAQDSLQTVRELVRGGAAAPTLDDLIIDIGRRVAEDSSPRLRRVFNLSGTVIHTNLGRALLAEEAIDAVAAAMRNYAALEYDVTTGGRGDRDDHVLELLRALTGAEAATVVNNCAAAVLLTLKALAARREVVISRGELIEIGGAFRMPDIMQAAGCRLVEVGTTNRTHPQDYRAALGPKTALLMTAHASNYAVTGFTARVEANEITAIAHAHGVPYVVDLGSGALIDFARFGLPREPLPQDALAEGADLVLFSGDKLLGGPQAGIIVGRADLIAKIKRDPLKRALRISKLTLAALEATLRVTASGHRLSERLPTLRLLARSREDIEASCTRVREALVAWVGADYEVRIEPCASQIGSGSQPVERLPSAALVVTSRGANRTRGRALISLEARLRALPIPIIGRLHDNALWLDARCLMPDDEPAFVEDLRAA